MLKKCYIFLILIIFILLNGCETNPVMSSLDLRPKYKKFEGKFIKQVKTKEWQPALTRANNEGSDSSLYLPTGLTLVRSSFDGIVKTEDMERYIESICVRLLKNSPIKNVSIKVKIIAHSDFETATAMPDGTIAIPLGLIESVDNEDELAWVVGHELSHVILGHHDVDWLEKYHEQLLGVTKTAVFLTDAIYKSSEQNYIKGQSLYGGTKIPEVEETKESKEKVDETDFKMDRSYFLTTGVVLPAWSRDQEDEADLLGIDLVSAAGYSSLGSLDILDRLASKLKEIEKQYQEELDRKREEISNKYSQNKGFDISNIIKGVREHFKLEMKEIQRSLAKKHRDIEERLEYATSYIEREYEDSLPDGRPQFVGLEKLRKKTNVNRILKRYKNVWDAEDLLSEGKLDKAAGKIRKAISGSTKFESKPRMTFFKIRREQGEVKKSILNLEYALREKNASFKIYLNFVEHYILSGQLEKASDMLDTTWEEFEHPPYLYPTKIRLAKLKHEDKVVKQLLLECTQNAAKFADQCKKSASG